MAASAPVEGRLGLVGAVAGSGGEVVDGVVDVGGGRYGVRVFRCGAVGRYLVENCSRFSVWGWPSSAGEIAGGMASIVVGRLGSCGRIMGQFFPCRSNGPASRCPDAPPRSCLMPRGRGFRVLCCLMTSESFGCHDISRHWWGASAGWESCCFSLPERGCPGHCGGLQRRLDALHEGWVLLDEGWGYWR